MTPGHRARIALDVALGVFVVVATVGLMTAVGGWVAVITGVLAGSALFAAGYAFGRRPRRPITTLYAASPEIHVVGDLGAVSGTSLDRLVRQHRQAQDRQHIGTGGHL